MARKTDPNDWEVPRPSEPVRDPWSAPGQRHGSAAPMCCAGCGVQVSIFEAFARDGDLFCARCRPAGAVGADSLPSDPMLHPRDVDGQPVRSSRQVRAGDVAELILEALDVAISVIFRR